MVRGICDGPNVDGVQKMICSDLYAISNLTGEKLLFIQDFPAVENRLPGLYVD